MGSVSGSRLVTQNLLLGLDRGWMTGLWTVGAQIQGMLRAGGEEAARGLGRGGWWSASSCSGEVRWQALRSGPGHFCSSQQPLQLS